jgi:hypothetical protein
MDVVSFHCNSLCLFLLISEPQMYCLSLKACPWDVSLPRAWTWQFSQCLSSIVQLNLLFFSSILMWDSFLRNHPRELAYIVLSLSNSNHFLQFVTLNIRLRLQHGWKHLYDLFDTGASVSSYVQMTEVPAP